MKTSKNFPHKSVGVYTLCLFIHLSLYPAAWNAVDVLDMMMRATLSMMENELEELKLSRISLIRAAILPLNCEPPEFYMRDKYISKVVKQLQFWIF